MHIEVTRDVIDVLRAEAIRANRRECCGIMLGSGGRITVIAPATNIHPAPERHFEIHPQALIDAHRAAREGGPEVIGYYHSHPVGEAVPSPTDRAMASGDGRIWAIIAGEDVKFWRDAPEGFEALCFQVAED